MNILVTGGAGFIGSFLVDELVKKKHRVTVYDNLEKQVHLGKKPVYLNKQARYLKADITDMKKLNRALEGMDIVFHEAAMVGVGQSMFEIEKYTRVNTYGTAVLLDLIVNKHRRTIKKLVVAASMSEYGEGLYSCVNCGKIKPDLRSENQLNKADWEISCPNCRSRLKPIATTEDVKLSNSSIYAINKKDQEEMCILIGKTFKLPTVALRYFNVYGPRQSLSNPYTGVAAIFISRIKAGKPPFIFEDGKQSRDFVSVHDIVDANIAVMENQRADYNIYNVGSGEKISIAELGNLLVKLINPKLTVKITNQFRKGDIRHCFSDISRIKREIGWKPKIKLDHGLKELIAWSQTVKSKDMFDQATAILKKKGVV